MDIELSEDDYIIQTSDRSSGMDSDLSENDSIDQSSEGSSGTDNESSDDGYPLPKARRIGSAVHPSIMLEERKRKMAELSEGAATGESSAKRQAQEAPRLTARVTRASVTVDAKEEEAARIRLSKIVKNHPVTRKRRLKTPSPFKATPRRSLPRFAPPTIPSSWSTSIQDASSSATTVSIPELSSSRLSQGTPIKNPTDLSRTSSWSSTSIQDDSSPEASTVSSPQSLLGTPTKKVAAPESPMTSPLSIPSGFYITEDDFNDLDTKPSIASTAATTSLASEPRRSSSRLAQNQSASQSLNEAMSPVALSAQPGAPEEPTPAALATVSTVESSRRLSDRLLEPTQTPNELLAPTSSSPVKKANENDPMDSSLAKSQATSLTLPPASSQPTSTISEASTSQATSPASQANPQRPAICQADQKPAAPILTMAPTCPSIQTSASLVPSSTSTAPIRAKKRVLPKPLGIVIPPGLIRRGPSTIAKETIAPVDIKIEIEEQKTTVLSHIAQTPGPTETRMPESSGTTDWINRTNAQGLEWAQKVVKKEEPEEN